MQLRKAFSHENIATTIILILIVILVILGFFFCICKFFINSENEEGEEVDVRYKDNMGDDEEEGSIYDNADGEDSESFSVIKNKEIRSKKGKKN